MKISSNVSLCVTLVTVYLGSLDVVVIRNKSRMTLVVFEAYLAPKMKAMKTGILLITVIFIYICNSPVKLNK